jgi:hypothetical protein
MVVMPVGRRLLAVGFDSGYWADNGVTTVAAAVGIR